MERSYVPGYTHDIFVSYAHGDDVDWLERLIERLQTTLDRRLGIPVRIWWDKEGLASSKDYRLEIPAELKSSALFLFFPSPKYVRSDYCVRVECQQRLEQLDVNRSRYAAPEFANQLFALRCPILPIAGNVHQKILAGASDIPFCDDDQTFKAGTRNFQKSFLRLTGELATLLESMRNHATPVFLYPKRPGPEIAMVRAALETELYDRSYRVLPDEEVDLANQVRQAELSVFLVGPGIDAAEATELVRIARSETAKPWVVWRSPATDPSSAAAQFAQLVETGLASDKKSYFDQGVAPERLRREIRALLRQDRLEDREARSGRARIYLVYETGSDREKAKAVSVTSRFGNDFRFEMPDDPVRHSERLMRSDGVLLLWGDSDESWCAREFQSMMQAVRPHTSPGLIVFNPRSFTKVAAVQQIRSQFANVYVGEQYECELDAARLEPFFAPLRQRAQEAR